MSKEKFSFNRLTEKDVEECANTLLKKFEKALDPKIRNKNVIKNMIYGPHAMTVVAKKGNEIWEQQIAENFTTLKVSKDLIFTELLIVTSAVTVSLIVISAVIISLIRLYLSLSYLSI